MKRATLFEGIGVALIASIVSSALFVTLASVFSSLAVFRLLISVLCLAYLVYLLSRSQARIGRVTVIGLWFAVSVTTWFFVASPLLYLVIHLGLIWLVRALYFYNNIASALTDLGLTGLSLAIAIWAWSSSHSMFLSVWCFFIVQALFVLIPRQLGAEPHNAVAAPDSDDPFERAHRSAQTALRKLTSIH